MRFKDQSNNSIRHLIEIKKGVFLMKSLFSFIQIQLIENNT